MNIPEIIKDEIKYQQQQLKLIPSENYTSINVMKAVGSVLMNKYAEGQAGKRYYQGNRNIDKIETACKRNALELFGLSDKDWHVNVQAVTGSIANATVYAAVLNPGDKILAMNLTHGGHISHGWKLPDGRKVSFTSRVYQTDFYNIDPKTFVFDYDKVEKKALKFKPKLIISGGTAYPHKIDFKRLSEIAHKVGAKYLADVAHEAGLIAGGVYPSPFEYADFVTMTSRKTLRGPIGALIFAKKEYEEDIDRSVFPGLQGGPMINSIAGIAIALEEANTKEFKEYTKQVITNAKVLADELKKLDFQLVGGNTETHLILIDIRNKQPDGLIAAEILETADIILNKNTIPFDESASPWRPSGIRLGTPAITTRGFIEEDMKTIADLINRALSIKKFSPETKRVEINDALSDSKEIEEIKEDVHKLTSKHPVYPELG